MIDHRRPTRAVWLATALFVLGSTIWAVVIPLFHQPDEAEHYDLITALAANPHYPQYDERAVNGTVDHLARNFLLAGNQYRQPLLGGLQPPAAAATANLADPVVLSERAGSNQMPQHPPLYYQGSAVVLRAVRVVLPGDRTPSIATEILILRLLNVLLVSSIPIAVAVVTSHLTRSIRASEVAAFACLLIPQFLNVSGAINNDNLLNLIGAWLTVVIVVVARGRASWGTALVGGLLFGLAMLTKAFGVVFVPALGLAYLFSALRTRRYLVSAGQLAVTGALGAVMSGWFWIGNVVRQGQVAPTTFFERAGKVAPGTHLDQRAWFEKAAYSIPQRFWGSAGRYAANMVWEGWALLTLAVVVGIVVLLARRGNGIERRAALTGLVPIVVLAAYVVQHAHHIFVVTGWTSFLQGRYLFSGLAGLLAAAAAGWDRLSAGRLNHRHVLVVAAVAQLLVLRPALVNIWGGPGISTLDAIHTMLLWTPMPKALVLLLVAVTAVAAVLALLVRPADEVSPVVPTEPDPEPDLVAAPA